MTEVDSAPALKVLGSMETLNIYDVTQDPARTLICCPIRNSKTHDVIGRSGQGFHFFFGAGASCSIMSLPIRILRNTPIDTQAL